MRFPPAAALALLAACSSPPSLPPAGPESPITEFTIARGGISDASLLAAWVAPGGLAWVGGSEGTVLRDDGLRWVRERLPTDTDIVTGLTGLTDNATVFATAGSAVYERRDAQWITATVAAGRLLLGAWALDDEHVYAIGTGGTVLLRTAGAWQALPAADGAELWGIWGAHPDSLVVVGQSSAAYAWRDGAWQALALPVQAGLFAVAGDGTGRVVMVGTQGTVLRRDGEGPVVQVTVPSDDNLFAVWSTGPGSFLIAGDRGTLLTGDGETFTPVAVPSGRENLRALAGPPGQRRAVGWWGTVLHEALGWRPALSGARLYGAHFPADGAPLVVGAGGLGYERSGGDWRVVDLPAPATLLDVAGPSAAARLAVGDSGVILRFQGGGWSAEPSPYPGPLRSIWWEAGDRAMVVGAEGTALVHEGGGWRAVPTGTGAYLRHVWGPSWGDLWAVGDSGVVLRWNGSAWRRLATPAPPTTTLRGVWGASARDVWVVGDGGTILRFDGTGWRTVLGIVNDLRGVQGVAGSVFIYGELGGIWRWTGTEFAPQPIAIPGFLLGHDGGGTRGLVIAGELGTVVEGR